MYNDKIQVFTILLDALYKKLCTLFFIRHWQPEVTLIPIDCYLTQHTPSTLFWFISQKKRRSLIFKKKDILLLANTYINNL